MRLLWCWAITLVAASAQDVASTCANPIVGENTLPGSPSNEWDINGAGDPTIQGFATSISVSAGEDVSFKVKTDANSYRIDIYRLGYYGGDGARRHATLAPSAPLPQHQPECLYEESTQLVDCGTWEVSATWQVPPETVSGLFVARLVRTDPVPADKENWRTDNSLDHWDIKVTERTVLPLYFLSA